MAISESIVNNILHDLSICQHLHSKISSENANWRPQENMRTTLELMQYLCFIGKVTVDHYLNGPTDRSKRMEAFAAQSAWSGTVVTFENFSEMIEAEKHEIKTKLAKITDNDLATRQTYYPWSNQDATLFEGLTTTLKFICAYRHQLFLYAKMQGANIGTMNNWAGMDSPVMREQLQEEAA